MKKIIKLFLFLSIGISGWVGFSHVKTLLNSTSHSTTKESLKVVTSIFPVYEIVKEVAGQDADVSLMVSSNEDAHHYEPDGKSVAALNEADIFIYSSDVMEFWVENLLEVVENEDLQVIELIDEEELDDILDEEENHDDHHHHGHDHGNLDPHFWVDPIKVKDQIPRITKSFSKADPKNKNKYVRNAQHFSDELTALDFAFREAFSNVEKHNIVVQHKSFGHLANRYGFEQISVGGLTTEVEPDPKTLIQVIKFIKKENIPVIYYQSSEKSLIAETISRETNTEIEVLYDLENKPNGLEENNNLYLEAMYHNLEMLKKSID